MTLLKVFPLGVASTNLPKAKNCRDSDVHSTLEHNQRRPSTIVNSPISSAHHPRRGCGRPLQAPNIARYRLVANWPVLKRYVVWIRIQRRYAFSVAPNRLSSPSPEPLTGRRVRPILQVPDAASPSGRRFWHATLSTRPPRTHPERRSAIPPSRTTTSASTTRKR